MNLSYHVLCHVCDWSYMTAHCIHLLFTGLVNALGFQGECTVLVIFHVVVHVFNGFCLGTAVRHACFIIKDP